jgi:hypothetical protein
VIVSDSPTTRNLLGQSKKVGCRCPHYFRETDSQYLSKSQKIVYIGHQFNDKTEKRHPPPHLTGHEVYEMIKGVHIVLSKQKMTGKKY